MSIQPLYRDKTGRVFVKFFKKLHWIEDYGTLGALFGSNPRITNAPPDEEGFPIKAGACLINAQDKLSLYNDGKKYWITSLDMAAYFQFNGKRFPIGPEDLVLADNLLKLASDGGKITA